MTIRPVLIVFIPAMINKQSSTAQLTAMMVARGISFLLGLYVVMTVSPHVNAIALLVAVFGLIMVIH